MSLQVRLRELFLLDQQVRGLRTRLDGAQARQRALQGKADRLAQQRSELASQHKLLQAKAGGFELQAREFEDRVNRLREQMNTVTSNKEYSALLIEVNTMKLEKSKVEDQALEQMQQVETVAKELKEIDDKLTEQHKMVELAKSEVKSASAEIAEQLAETTQKRDAAQQEIPDEPLALFKRLLEIHDGEAMAPVIEESRRHMEYSCGGCYMSIPVERVNALSTRADQAVCCPSCGRILYLDAALKESMGIK